MFQRLWHSDHLSAVDQDKGWAFSIWIHSHFHVCIYIYSNILHLRPDNQFSEPTFFFFPNNLHYKIFQRRFHFGKAETVPCNTGYVQMSDQWMKKAISILLQIYFTVVSEDNGFVLTSAELQINCTRCVLAACSIQSSNETWICATPKGRWGFSQTRTKSYESRNLLQRNSTDVAWKVIHLIQTVKFSETFSGARKSLQVSHKIIWKHR